MWYGWDTQVILSQNCHIMSVFCKIFPMTVQNVPAKRPLLCWWSSSPLLCLLRPHLSSPSPPPVCECRKLVTNNTHQCRVIEVLLTRGPWTGREEMDYDAEHYGPYVVFASKGVSLPLLATVECSEGLEGGWLAHFPHTPSLLSPLSSIISIQ